MSQWFCAVGGQQSGPMDEAQVRQLMADRRLGSEDLAWREGMAQWSPVRTIAELAPHLPAPYAPPAVAGPFVPMPGAWGQAPAPYAPPAVPLGPPGMVAQAAHGAPGFAPPGPTLSYATPAGLAPMPVARPTLPNDEGPFIYVGGRFHTGRARWSGKSIASPQAFYLLKASQQQNYHGGGLIGALIVAAMSQADDTRTCYVGELPPAVRAELDPKGKRLDRDVIVLPRQAIRLLKPAVINNVFHVYAGYEKITVDAGLFRKGKVKRFLAEHGWDLNQELIPTVAPIHGFGFGRYPGGPGPRRGGLTGFSAALLIIVVLFIIGIAIASATHR